jgi:hypothetical protein
MTFSECVEGLIAGDFSRLAPLFEAEADGAPCQIIRWYEAGSFQNQTKALAEAFSCACFNGFVSVVEYFLARGLDPNGGANTGMNAFHWAANRGQLEVVNLLIQHKAALEALTCMGAQSWAEPSTPWFMSGATLNTSKSSRRCSRPARALMQLTIRRETPKSTMF